MASMAGAVPFIGGELHESMPKASDHGPSLIRREVIMPCAPFMTRASPHTVAEDRDSGFARAGNPLNECERRTQRSRVGSHLNPSRQFVLNPATTGMELTHRSGFEKLDQNNGWSMVRAAPGQPEREKLTLKEQIERDRHLVASKLWEEQELVHHISTDEVHRRVQLLIEFEVLNVLAGYGSMRPRDVVQRVVSFLVPQAPHWPQFTLSALVQKQIDQFVADELISAQGQWLSYKRPPMGGMLPWQKVIAEREQQRINGHQGIVGPLEAKLQHEQPHTIPPGESLSVCAPRCFRNLLHHAAVVCLCLTVLTVVMPLSHTADGDCVLAEDWINECGPFSVRPPARNRNELCYPAVRNCYEQHGTMFGDPHDRNQTHRQQRFSSFRSGSSAPGFNHNHDAQLQFVEARTTGGRTQFV